MKMSYAVLLINLRYKLNTQYFHETRSTFSHYFINPFGTGSDWSREIFPCLPNGKRLKLQARRLSLETENVPRFALDGCVIITRERRASPVPAL